MKPETKPSKIQTNSDITTSRRFDWGAILLPSAKVSDAEALSRKCHGKNVKNTNFMGKLRFLDGVKHAMHRGTRYPWGLSHSANRSKSEPRKCSRFGGVQLGKEGESVCTTARLSPFITFRKTAGAKEQN